VGEALVEQEVLPRRHESHRHSAANSVIEPSQTRAYIVRALRALRTKREQLPPKKHGNIPL